MTEPSLTVSAGLVVLLAAAAPRWWDISISVIIAPTILSSSGYIVFLVYNFNIIYDFSMIVIKLNLSQIKH